MAESSKIEWTDATWNPVTGCSVVSPGCTNCYAMRLAGTRLGQHPSRAGLTRDTKAGPVWTGDVRLNEQWLTQPLEWRRPRMIFVCAHADLFHEAVPDAWIDRIFAVMALAPRHTFQVLTKRSGQMRAYLSTEGRDGAANRIRYAAGGGSGIRDNWRWPLPNVWLGVSAEDQRRADERREDLALLAEAGWTTFVSYEPALGPVIWAGWDFLSWLISGGESGPQARPSHPDWHRASRDFCTPRGIPYFFKQWGAWAPGECAISAQVKTESTASWWDDRWSFGRVTARQGEAMHIDDEPDLWRVSKKAAGRLLDGVEHNGMPACGHASVGARP